MGPHGELQIPSPIERKGEKDSAKIGITDHLGAVIQGTTLSDDPKVALATFSVNSAMRGIGNVLAGPTSAALITSEVVPDEYAIGKFKGVVIYTGSCMIASSSTMVIWGIARRYLRKAKAKGEFCGCPA